MKSLSKFLGDMYRHEKTFVHECIAFINLISVLAYGVLKVSVPLSVVSFKNNICYYNAFK